MADPSAPVRTGTWTPLTIPAFRALWVAQLVSNIGTWMQTVGAQWLLVNTPNATVLTALAQAASLLPVLFISLPAGVLADILDRRRYLVATQVAAIAVVSLLAVLTALGVATPSVVLLLTFAVGITAAMASPAWQAIQPQLVPAGLIPAAAALGGMSINLARAIGPALAGAVIAVTSPALVFALNAVSTVFVVVALLRWRPAPRPQRQPERIVPALRSGSRYVAHAPVVRRILLRSALFVVPASALWALLAVVSSERLGLGSGGYGLMLGSLGAGAVLGAVVLGRVRATMSSNWLIAAFSMLYAVGMVGAAVVTSAPVLMLLLLASGIGWLVMLSTFNAALQVTLAEWVRARGLSTYLIVFLGGQGVGALVWGAVGEALGVPATLMLATALLVVGAATLLRWPLHTVQLDRTTATPWPDPEVDVEPDPDAGPVVIEVSYRVRENVEEFVAAAAALGLSRRRTGASAWALYQDVADRTRFVEICTVPTWSEHLRQHYERMTGFDQQVVRRVESFDTGEPRDEPASRHLVAIRTS